MKHQFEVLFLSSQTWTLGSLELAHANGVSLANGVVETYVDLLVSICIFLKSEAIVEYFVSNHLVWWIID